MDQGEAAEETGDRQMLPSSRQKMHFLPSRAVQAFPISSWCGTVVLTLWSLQTVQQCVVWNVQAFPIPCWCSTLAKTFWCAISLQSCPTICYNKLKHYCQRLYEMSKHLLLVWQLAQLCLLYDVQYYNNTNQQCFITNHNNIQSKLFNNICNRLHRYCNKTAQSPNPQESCTSMKVDDALDLILDHLGKKTFCNWKYPYRDTLKCCLWNCCRLM